MPNFTTTLGIQWTPPAAPDNSGNSTYTVQNTYVADNVGRIDIPNGTVIGTVFPIPFGGVGRGKMIVIKNKMTSDIGIRLNAAIANNFELGPDGEFAYITPTAPATTPLSSIDIVTTVDPTNLESVFYHCLGQ